jgi:NADPH2:quinone reductase
MRAVVLTRHGGPEVLSISDIPSPVPGPEEVLVDVFATALNRADVLQRLGFYANPHPEAYEIPGLEFAGVVAAIGSRCRYVSVGDRVMGIVGGGAYAEQLVTHERQLLAVPDDLDLATAAAIPEAFITAWDALVVQGGLTSGRWALIHAGASGVGTAGIEIAKSVGARVAVTCSAGKAGICEEVGADLVFERSPHDWLADAKANLPDGFDVILDVVGGDELARNISALALKGRIIQVGTMGAAQTSINLGALMGKRGTITGTLLRARPLEEKIAITQRFAAEVLPLIASGHVQPYIDSVVSINDLAAAHERMEANLNAGKIVVTLR